MKRGKREVSTLLFIGEMLHAPGDQQGYSFVGAHYTALYLPDHGAGILGIDEDAECFGVYDNFTRQMS